MSSHGDFEPFRGLLPYTAEYEKYLFGRKAEREIIAANLYISRLTVLHAQTGVGKTSVLQAGVIPMLKADPHALCIVHRQWQAGDVLDSLKENLISLVKGKFGRDLNRLATERLDVLLEAINERIGGPVVLVFDQFEEFFLYHSRASSIFDTEFALAVNRRDIEANFLLVMREETLSQLDRFQARIPDLLSNLLRLENLDRASVESGIHRALKQYNADFRDPRGEITIEPELIGKLLSDKVTFEPFGRGEVKASDEDDDLPTIPLPFLQIALLHLWREERRVKSPVLRQSTFRRMGGARGIVLRHLDETVGVLPPPQKKVASHLFHHLVTPSGTKIAHTVSDLAEYTRSSPETIEKVLTALNSDQTRLFRSVPVQSGSKVLRYEIFHDALAPAILDWRRRYRETVRRSQTVVALLAALLVVGIPSALLYQYVRGNSVNYVLSVMDEQVQKGFAAGARIFYRSHVKPIVRDDSLTVPLELLDTMGYYVQGACDLDCDALRIFIRHDGQEVANTDTLRGSALELLPFESGTYDVTMKPAACRTHKCFSGLIVHSYNPSVQIQGSEVVATILRDSIDERIAAGGGDPDRAVQVQSSLGASESRDVHIQLVSGHEYKFVAACDSNCSRLDLTISRDSTLAQITNTPTPTLSFVARESGHHVVEVRSPLCRAVKCLFVLEIAEKSNTAASGRVVR